MPRKPLAVLIAEGAAATETQKPVYSNRGANPRPTTLEGERKVLQVIATAVGNGDHHCFKLADLAALVDMTKETLRLRIDSLREDGRLPREACWCSTFDVPHARFFKPAPGVLEDAISAASAALAAQAAPGAPASGKARGGDGEADEATETKPSKVVAAKEAKPAVEKAVADSVEPLVYPRLPGRDRGNKLAAGIVAANPPPAPIIVEQAPVAPLPPPVPTVTADGKPAPLPGRPRKFPLAVGGATAPAPAAVAAPVAAPVAAKPAAPAAPAPVAAPAVAPALAPAAAQVVVAAAPAVAGIAQLFAAQPDTWALYRVGAAVWRDPVIAWGLWREGAGAEARNVAGPLVFGTTGLEPAANLPGFAGVRVGQYRVLEGERSFDANAQALEPA